MRYLAGIIRLMLPRPPLSVLSSPSVCSRLVPWCLPGILTWCCFERHRLAIDLGVVTTLVIEFRVMTWLLRMLVLGLTLIRRLVSWTVLLLRLIMTMAPFRLCSCASALSRCLPLCRRRLTDGLLSMHTMLIRLVLTREVSWTCRVLLLESELVRCLRPRQLSLMLVRKCSCLWTLPMTPVVTLLC